jgi:hypothetical protein
VFRVATARCVIAGDTGFAHMAGAFDTPLIALYPDWMQAGICQLRNAIRVSEWWGIQAHHLNYTFFPNARRMRVVELGTDRMFSIAHVIESVRSVSVET